MIGQTTDYNIEVDGGKSKKGVVISFYTGNFISVSEYGSFVFHTGAKQKVIYTPKAFVEEPVLDVSKVIEELSMPMVEETPVVEEVKEELVLETLPVVEETKTMKFNLEEPEPKIFEEVEPKVEEKKPAAKKPATKKKR